MYENLKILDLLGPEVKLNINRTNTFKSNIGLLLSSIFITLVVLSFVAFGRDIIQKKQPVIIYNKVINEYPYVQFDSEFIFLFGFFDMTINPIPEINRLMTVYIEHNGVDTNKISKGENPFITNRYELEFCRPSRFSKNLTGIISMPLENYFCTPSNMSVPLKGSFSKQTYLNLRIVANICKNSTLNNNTCYSEDIIRTKKLPTLINYHYIMLDNYMDGYNYSLPGVNVLQSGSIRGNINSFTRFIYWLKNIEYWTDVGWILQDYRLQNYTSIDKLTTEIYTSLNTTTFFSHIITISDLKDIYYRSYIKIQGVFAFIGGFVSFFELVLRKINLYLIYPDYIYILTRKYYKNKLDSKKFNNLMKKNSKGNSSENDKNYYTTLFNPEKGSFNNGINSQNNIEISPKKQNSNMDETIVNKFNLRENKKLKNFRRNSTIGLEEIKFRNLTIWQKVFRGLFFIIDRKNEKMLNLIKFSKYLEQIISIENIIKFEKRINILYLILLEDFQRNLINFIQIPEKYETDINIFEDIKKLQKESKENYTSKLNMKILEFLDPKLKGFKK